MTKTMTNATNALRHDSDIGTGTTPDTQSDVTDTLHRPHSIASITLESGSTKRTVRRWLAKCGDIGTEKNGTRYFSDAEKVQILSHQRKSAATTDEVIEPELIEPGAIELHKGDASAAAPLLAFDLQPVQIDLPAADIAALQAHTEQLKPAAQQGANAINQYFAARMQLGVAKIAAEQDNLLAGVRANALNVGAQSLGSEGK